MDYSGYSRSPKLPPFPPTPLQRYLATPRYKSRYKSRSFQCLPRPMHRITYLNGQRAKLYNSNWLYPEVEHPGTKVDMIGKNNKLLLITSKRYGSAHDLSTLRKSPSSFESPSSQGYHSLSVPSSPFLSRRNESEPYRSYSYQQLYSPRTPSTPRRELLSSRRTYSASDIMSSSSYYDRHYGYVPYSPIYRRWTSNYDISYMTDHYSSTDALYGYQKSGSYDGLNSLFPSYFDFRPFSRESGIFGSEFRSRSGSGSILRSSRTNSDHLGEYRASTQSECDFPLRYRGPTSKSECGLSPNDVATRSESGFSLTPSELDNSFMMGDDETGSLCSVDRSYDRLEGLGVFPHVDLDLDRCETDSVVSHDRTLDIVYEDENSNSDQDAETASKRPNKPSASVSLLSRFEQAGIRHSSSPKSVNDSDDDVFRQHTDTLFISGGTNLHSSDEIDPKHGRHPITIRVSQYEDDCDRIREHTNTESGLRRNEHSDDVFRHHTDTVYMYDGANVQMEDIAQSQKQPHNSGMNNDDETFRQHTDTLYLIDGSNVHVDGTAASQHVSLNRPNNDSNDVVRHHTDTIYLFDGSNVQMEDKPQAQHNIQGTNKEDGTLRQHTDTLYVIDGSNVQVDDTSASQHASRLGQNDDNDDVVRHHTDTIYLFDGSNVQMEDMAQVQPPYNSHTKSKVQSQTEDDNDIVRHHTQTLYITEAANVCEDDSAERVVQVSPEEDVRQHTETIYIYDGDNVQMTDDVERQKVSPVIGTKDDFKHHTETVQISHTGYIHEDMPVARTSQDENIRHHIDTLYIYDGDNVVLDDGVERQEISLGIVTGDDMKNHTESIDISLSADVCQRDISGSTNIGEEDEIVRHHTESIYLYDGDNIMLSDETERQRVSPVTDAEENLRQHTETILISRSADIKLNDLSESISTTGGTSGNGDVRSEDEDVRHHTETIYMYDGDNVQLTDDVDKQKASAITSHEDEFKHHTETFQISHIGYVNEDHTSNTLITDTESEDENMRHDTETTYMYDVATVVHEEEQVQEDHSASDEDDSDNEELNKHRQIVYNTSDVNMHRNLRQNLGENSIIHTQPTTDDREHADTPSETERMNMQGDDTDYVRRSTSTVYIYDSEVKHDDDPQKSNAQSHADDTRFRNYAMAEQTPHLLASEDRTDKLSVSDENINPLDPKERTETLAVSEIKMESENSDFEDISNIELSAIERSEEFEIIEMPETVFSSSLIVENTDTTDGHMSLELSGSNDQYDKSGPAYAHNISAEYERADHESFEEFIDEREVTTSSQVHVNEEDSDSDHMEGHRSDNEISLDSSDDEFNTSSHRQLSQSASNSITSYEENNFSASGGRSVDELNQDVITYFATDNSEKVTNVWSEDKTLRHDNYVVTKSGTVYSVVDNHEPVHSMSVDKENMDISEIRVDVDTQLQFNTETQDIKDKSHNIYGDQYKTPLSLTKDKNETPPLEMKSDTSMQPGFDESSRSKTNDWQHESTGKKVGDSHGADKTPLRAEDNSLNQIEYTSGTADQQSSWSVSQADVKMGLDSDRGGASTNSVWKNDNVEEQFTTVWRKGEGATDEVQGSEVSDRTIHRTRHNAKIELAKSEQSAHVVTGEERSQGRESIDTLNIRQCSGINSDVVSQGTGNSQELLETENVYFSSSEADHSVPVSELSYHNDAALGGNINTDAGKVVKSEEIKKSRGESGSGVQGLENTNTLNILPVGKSEESGDIESLSDLSERQNYIDQSKQFVTDNSRTIVQSVTETLDEKVQSSQQDDSVFSASSDIVNQTASITEISSQSDQSGIIHGTDTNVTNFNQNIAQRIIVHTSEEKFIEKNSQVEEIPSDHDHLKANVELVQVSSTAIPEQCDIVSATGGVLSGPAIVVGENSMLHIDESHQQDLKARVENCNLGYLHDRADITKMSSAEMQVKDDRESALCFTDRTEITVPVEEKAVIKTKVQYTVKKLTKTVTKTNVNVKKVQKNTSGESVENEHLRKVEQMTVVSQKVWSSTESLDTDDPAEEKVQVEYKATYDVTKDKDGHQLPSAHFETGFAGELPTNVTTQALHGESEDILALCDPVSEKAKFSKTGYNGSIHGIEIENSPEFQTAEINHTIRGTQSEDEILSDINVEQAAGDNVTSVTTSQNVGKPEILYSDSHTKTGNSNIAQDGKSPDICVQATSSEESDVTTVTHSVKTSDTVSHDIQHSEKESPVYTERIEVFSSPITLSPVTVKRRRWSAEREFTDNKLICTLYEDTVSESLQPDRKDDALYILEDNIHVLNKATDRTEEFIKLPSKKSFKMQLPLHKPLWTYSLASFTPVDYTEQLGRIVDSDPERVVPPHSTNDKKASHLSNLTEVEISEINSETEENGCAVTSDSQNETASVTNTMSNLETNLNTTGTVSHVTLSSISHTSEMYEDNTTMNETMDKQISLSEVSVRSLPSATNSKQTLAESGEVRSYAGLPDTADVVVVSKHSNTHYTSFEGTEPYVNDTENSSLFLGGGSNERTADRPGHNGDLAATEDAQIQYGADSTENKQYSITETSESVKIQSVENNETLQTLQTVTIKTQDERETGKLSIDPNVWTDNNSNVLQVKESETLSLKQGNSGVCDLSDSSQTIQRNRETEDRSSVLDQYQISATVKDQKTDLCLQDENSNMCVTAPGSYGNKSSGLTGGRADLSSGVETNTDSLLGGRNSTFVTPSHSLLTDHPTQTTQISTYTAGCDTGSDNEGSVSVWNEFSSELSTADEKLSRSGETQNTQANYRNITVLSHCDTSGVHDSHAIVTTDVAQQRVFTSSQEENAPLYGSGTAHSAIETGESIDDQQTNLSTLHSAVDSTSTRDGLAYSGHTEVGKLNAETNRQNAISLQSVSTDDGMLINSQNLVEQEEKYANVTRAVGGKEFTSQGNVSIVSELETFGGSSEGLTIERAVTVTGELDISAVHSTVSDDESLDYDRDSRIKEFSEAFRKYSIEELPAQASRRNDQSISESRGRLTSVNDDCTEETEYSSKMSHFDYDDWTQSEAAQEQLRFNRSTEDGMKLHDEISHYSDSSFVKMDDISSSEDLNRSMGSESLDRLEWLESQVHTEDSGQWQGSSTNRSVLVTGQVEYDSDMEENNNYMKEMETSYAEDSDNSDMDTSESVYSATMTCEYKDGQSRRNISPSSFDESSTSLSEHMFGEFKKDLPEGKSRLLSSASSDGYFSSASEHMTGELRLNVSSDTFRHVSSTSSEGYHSFISDQMTGELKLSPSTDSKKRSSPTSDARRELEMVENDLKERIREFESWSEQLSGDVSQESDEITSSAPDQRTGVHSVTEHTQTVGHVTTNVSSQIHRQVKYNDQNLTQKGDLSSDQSAHLLTQLTSTLKSENWSDDIGVDRLNQLTLSQKYSSSDYATHQLKQGETGVTTYQLTHMSGDAAYAQATQEEQRLQHAYSSSDQRNSEMKASGQLKTISPSSYVTDIKTEQIQHGGLVSGSTSSTETRQKTQVHTSSLLSSEQTVRQTLTYSQEQETYENVPESISDKVKDELLKKSHGYFSSSVSVNLSKKWKLFEKLWHSFDEFSWQGNLAPHLFTFVFHRAVENQTDTVDQFDKLYPLLLIEDVERCQNHICMVLYTDEYLKQRKMQRYFLRGFTKDLKSLWHNKRKQSLAPLCDIPEERIVSFSDCASVCLPTCHTTSIHPSLVSFSPVSKLQYNRFTQKSDSMDTDAEVQKGDNSFDSGEDNSYDSLQYICQGDLSDPTIMMSKKLQELSRGGDTEILDDVLLRGLRHYRSKFMRFNPYMSTVVRKSVVRKQGFRNETIYEEEEDERCMD